MRAKRLYALLIAWSLAGIAPARAAEPPARRVPIALVDTVCLDETARGALQREVNTLFLKLGTEVAWSEPAGSDALPVILLNRTARTALSSPAARGSALVLGAAGRIEGPNGRKAVYVFHPSVREFVEGLLPRMAGGDSARQRALGVALGRVIAHELLHAYGIEHSESGLMAPQLDRCLWCVATLDEDTVAAWNTVAAETAAGVEP